MSGYLFPIILVFNSYNNFSDYQFINYNGQEIKNYYRNISFIVFPILLFFSTLITKYLIYLFSKNKKRYKIINSNLPIDLNKKIIIDKIEKLIK